MHVYQRIYISSSDIHVYHMHIYLIPYENIFLVSFLHYIQIIFMDDLSSRCFLGILTLVKSSSSSYSSSPSTSNNNKNGYEDDTESLSSSVLSDDSHSYFSSSEESEDEEEDDNDQQQEEEEEEKKKGDNYRPTAMIMGRSLCHNQFPKTNLPVGKILRLYDDSLCSWIFGTTK